MEFVNLAAKVITGLKACYDAKLHLFEMSPQAM